MCRLIAAEGYDEDLGIRSLINAVRDTVELSLFDSYLKVEKDIEEGQQMADYVVDVRNDEVAISMVSPKDEEVDYLGWENYLHKMRRSTQRQDSDSQR